MALTSYVLPNRRIDNLQISYAKTQPSYVVQFSNNAVETNVLSNTGKNDIVNVRIGQNICKLAPSCFICQTKLQSVTGSSDKLKDIGDYAFQGCRQLTSVSFIQKGSTHRIDNIGVSAFEGCGLKNVAIHLSGTSTATQIQAYAFANCTQLQSMENIQGNYLGDYEFYNCTSLTSITMPNSHSFSGEYSFKNCSSLISVKIPANTFMLNTGLFMGCSSLTSIVFDEPSHLKDEACLGNNFLNGTAITSLTIPASITSYTNIAPYAFSNMPNLKEIHFNGIPTSSIAEVYKDDSLQFETGIIYTSTENSNIYGEFKNKKSSYKFNDYFKEVSANKCKSIMNACVQGNIPLVLIRGNPNMSNCSHCYNWAAKTTHNSQFLNWLKSDQNKFVFIETGYDNYVSPFKVGGTFPYVDIYWKEESGKVHHFVATDGNTRGEYVSKVIGNANTFISKILSYFSGYDGGSTHIQVISSDIIENHCFGLNHNVILFGNDNTTKGIEYEDDGTGSVPQIIYNQSIQVDRITIDDFRYGQWYYNAKQLREYADINHLPVFVEFGSKNCGPCETFAAKVFNSSRFQSTLNAKKLLLCRISDTATFNSGQPQYVSKNWALRSEYPEGKMPILMFYWNQKNGMTNGYGNYIDEVHKKYAHFNNINDTDYTTCKLTYDLDSVLNWLNLTCFPLLENDPKYTPKSKFNLPSITQYITSYPRYKKYDNQNNDSYGRYFPVHTLKSVRRGIDDEYTIKVRNSSNVMTEYTINSQSTTGLPPNGTYQYFTMLSTTKILSSYYESNYDISGIIFKVGKEYTGKYLTSDSYSYKQKKFTDFLTENNLTGSNAAVNMTAFYDDIYAYDNNDDPTIQIDFDNFDDGEPIYNILKVYNVENVTKSGKTIGQIKAYISASVEVTGDVGEKEINPIGDEYLMSCNWYYVEESVDKVLWLSTFTNVDAEI